MALNTDYQVPFYDISQEIGDLRSQLFEFITSFSFSFYMTLFSISAVVFVLYLIWYIRYAVKEAIQ